MTSSALAPTPPIDSPRGTILAGMLIIIGAFGGFGTWAALAPLDSAIVASGVVVVESNRRDVQHLDGGIVQEILVREGTAVRAGDVLLRLDPTRAQAALAIVQGQMDAARALRARLLAEQREAAEVTFPPDLQARQGSASVLDLLQGQATIFAARRASLNGQVDILRQRIAQFEQQIMGLQAQEHSRDRQISLITDELGGVRDLQERGFATRTRLLALEREAARLQGERGEHVAAMGRLRQSIGETELQILQTRRTFLEEVARGLQEVQNQLLELQERLTAAEDVLRRLEVRAPVDGTVVGLAVHTIEGVLPAGRTVMQIVPVQDAPMVEAQVQTLDAEGLTPGMSASIYFPSLPQRTLPNLTGTVEQVSADRFVDERTGTPYYKVRIALDAETLERVGSRRVVPGMPAEVAIATGSRTALRYFLDPLLTAFRYAMRER